MRFTTTFTLLLLLSIYRVNGQEIVTDLNGFRLGQFRETATNEFGKPSQKDKFEDGYEYEIFMIKPNSSLYMVFEYAAEDTNTIWSIQVTGTDNSTDIGFKNLRLDMDKKQVENLLGKPSQKVNIGEYGERWEYENTNYSVEISTKGRLSSVKIKNTYADEKPDLNKLPVFKNIVSWLLVSNNSNIAAILSPGLEIYYKDNTIRFKKSLQNEIKSDYSKVFKTIRQLSKDLGKINVSDSNVYSESVRIILGQNFMCVMKFKSGTLIKEIVFRYENGEYLIWEINAE